MTDLTRDERQALKDLVVRCVRALDSDAPAAEIAALFTDDATIREPSLGALRGTNAVGRWVTVTQEGQRVRAARRCLTNLVVTGSADQAVIRAYALEFSTPRTVADGEKRATSFAYAADYECTASRIGGAWRLRSWTKTLVTDLARLGEG